MFPGGCSALTTYRLYKLDKARKISSAEWLDAADDDAAVSQAHIAVGRNGGKYELWQRNRLVARDGVREL